jgi:hypothetical protein
VRRILVLLTVGAIMVLTLVGGVTSAAFGRPTITSGCIIHSDRPGGVVLTDVSEPSTLAKFDRNGDHIVCVYSNNFNELHFTDNTYKL